LLQLLPDPHHDTLKMEAAVKAYFAGLRGFFEQPDNSRTEAAEDQNAAQGLNRQGGLQGDRIGHIFAQ
jgi:hypothetical protein